MSAPGAAGVLPARLFAPAKLTLSLRVTGVRSDGFHLIDAEMVTLDVGDELHLTQGDGLVVTGVGAQAADGPSLGAPDENLVTRALRLVGREARVSLTKAIPPGAGLGGGSADAAAVLRWAGWQGSTAELEQAARLGADVAFCLVGGRARVSGIGEVVERLPPRHSTLTLFTPPFGCSTPAVYRAWDDLGSPRGDNGNDLEPAALAVEPRLAPWRDLVAEHTGTVPRLAGSGSTWFVQGAHPSAIAAIGHGMVVHTAGEHGSTDDGRVGSSV